MPGDGAIIFADLIGKLDVLYKSGPVCDLGLEGIVSKRLTSIYPSGPSRTWIKVKNPKAPAATRAGDGTF
jgi:ATP-dependent DNA ligase